MSRLLDEINKYQEAFKEKVPQDIQQVMLDATENLKKLSLSKNALKVTDKAIDFELPNAVNKPVSLKEALENNEFVVINFYRGIWCPYCNLELQALQSINSELEKLNAKLIAISPQTPDSSLTTKEKNELEFEVLSDKDNKVAKEYGLVFSLAEELRPIYKSFGIDIEAANEENSFELPMPATYIVNKNQEIIYSFIDEDYTKRSEPQTILDIIQKNS
ncbi:peroxiredoxin-like family protein [Halarcobacter bivalviorum]|uniref:thioredoxin-dependent peroxiredoxin n=1 Tax=Halarcobacter bivalviorum TaxID=663364 RepID=A0AAX2AB56_9BACT|nr:peroxiredoxin-like family protein [Halarcobacter bivalviorum]AXH11738.1 alkyl hydroperoxide reductase [Halarcobacter bivalviorum]RXK10867.1 alkyl hydroperoxide reductase [Halarcobacter bivalviorum]